ncbi:MAG: hypothetical protein H6R14_1228 [Proteobacteria bacterium]|nr:hypothetical protein [Pseudomonadota bacterium]
MQAGLAKGLPGAAGNLLSSGVPPVRQAFLAGTILATKFQGFIGVLLAVGCSVAMSVEATRHSHHRMAKDVDAFHAVLAPVWHARPSPERTRNACAKRPEMAALAGNIRSRDASGLVAALARLKTSCEDGKGEVDAAFYDVHEAFHDLID